MSNVIMIGCDLHEDTLMLKIAVGLETPETRLWKKRAGSAADGCRFAAAGQRQAFRGWFSFTKPRVRGTVCTIIDGGGL